MSKSLVRFLTAGGLALLVLGAFVVAAEPDKDAAATFKVLIASKMDLDIQNKKQKIVTETEYVYTWKRNGKERDLTYESLRVKVSDGETEKMNVLMNRDKVATTQNGVAQEVPFDKAPEDVKKKLQDSFGAVLCKVQVDANGKEVKRTVVAGPGAKELVDNGMIANALLFHGPFFPDKDEWQADAEISMGNGGYAKGKLTYKKIPGGKGGPTYKVSGTLSNDSFPVPGAPLTIKDARYVVTGEQTFDPAQKEWTAGKLSIEVAMQMIVNEQAIGSTKGIMAVTFEKQASKK
jgi:hypothetical protein